VVVVVVAMVVAGDGDVVGVLVGTVLGTVLGVVVGVVVGDVVGVPLTTRTSTSRYQLPLTSWHGAVTVPKETEAAA
jgi:membrane protein YqaA with SNARE-associated domain